MKASHSVAESGGWANSISVSVSVTKRNGELAPYDPNKIIAAIEKALASMSASKVMPAHSSKRINAMALKLGTLVHEKIQKNLNNFSSTKVHIETIQDYVELVLMQNKEYELAKQYVLYREEKARKRKDLLNVNITKHEAKGKNTTAQLQSILMDLYPGCDEFIGYEGFFTAIYRGIYKGIDMGEIYQLIQMNASANIKYEPEYTYLAARSLLKTIEHENANCIGTKDIAPEAMFTLSIEKGVDCGILDSNVIRVFDLKRLAKALKQERNDQFNYIGLKNLYDRYLLKDNKKCFESPQGLFMRVAMGLAHQEQEPNKYAIMFYNLLSRFDFMSSTPTLFNSATKRPQLSSCYLTQIPDDLAGIFDGIKDNALLSKYAGGLGNAWASVRGLGAHIKGTNGESQGIIPFLKIVSDAAVAVNQGGKRKGAVCAYLETWHIDVEEFIELRKNTGDERRRTHDMHSANWIPDLFMERVAKEEEWTLFSPDETPELCDLYGDAFRAKYEEYELLAKSGKLQNTKVVGAVELWKKMLGMLFETGHPWITFKDPANIRSPQKHTGVVHSSNLCTEITLNTSDDEIAVCNLGSINLTNHLDVDGNVDEVKLRATIKVACRMLDNVINYNHYPVEKAKTSNLKNRPIGLGQMGFQDVLNINMVPYDSDQAIALSNEIAEMISYFAIEASVDLAEEKGVYDTFEGSDWSKGILPMDTYEALKVSRNGYFKESEIAANHVSKFDWDGLRKRVSKGMRNSNVMAIAPTATISNITGVSQSTEPTYQQIHVKSNLSGEFTHVNKYLVNTLKANNLWDEEMANLIIDSEGSIQDIPQIPVEIKAVYKNSFEFEPQWLVECSAVRQKWIDQAASLNLYMSEPSGKKLDNLYKLAWVRGLKTTYYLRSMAATGVRDEQSSNASATFAPKAMVCNIDDSECEACQ